MSKRVAIPNLFECSDDHFLLILEAAHSVMDELDDETKDRIWMRIQERINAGDDEFFRDHVLEINVD